MSATLFSVKIDRVLFHAATWHGKYRLVQVEVDNRSKVVFRMSSAKDQVEAIVQGKRVRAVLQPAKAAPEQWDLLDQETRERMAYPRQIKAQDRATFYVLFPADELTGLPESFKFRIDGVDAVIDVPKPPARAN